MVLGAFVDAGFALERIDAIAAALRLDASITATPVIRAGVRATRLAITDREPAEERPAGELIARVRGAALGDTLRARSVAALELLAEVEGAIHGVAPAAVRFHELSGADTLIDVVGTFAALEELEIGSVGASVVNLGGGTVQLAHGRIAVPAPAVAALLIDRPVRGTDGAGELTTPTGALLLRTIVDRWGPLPAMRLERVGSGAGTRDTAAPNVVRCFIGTSLEDGPGWRVETVAVLETNIDDLQPQVYEHLTERLFAAGALDVTLAAVVGKRGRPAVVVQAIARPDAADAVAAALFAESSTLGIRRRFTERLSLERRIARVDTSLGPVDVKLARLPDGSERAAPEYRDLARIARETGLPLVDVLRRVQREL